MLETGTLIDGKYRILEEIGRGGMSIVYRVINERANKIWAMKEVRRDGVLDFESVRQGLVVETDLLKRLHHPNLPGIVDVIEDEETFLIVMDYVEGNTLSERIAELGAQRQEDVLRWAGQLCDVLSYLHAQEPAIIYRDMKPGNIMLRPDGSVCLIDFGTAREYKKRNLEDTACLGTIGYAAPEQFGGMGQTDARTDIYGLGATLYHLLTGVSPTMEPPYYGMRPIREIHPELSDGLERIIQKCTQENPNERYQSCAEVRYALEHYKEMEGSFRRKLRRRRMGFVLAVVCFLIFLGGGISLQRIAVWCAADEYEQLLAQAELLTGYEERLKAYQKAIAVPDMAGEPDAYLAMIDLFESYYTGDLFTEEEEQLLIGLVTQNEQEISRNADGYVEVCFEMGKLYWYYYDCGEGGDNQATRARYAAKWFTKVLEAVGTDSDYEHLGMAMVYSEVGNFYSQITKNIIQGEDAGTYAPFFEDLCILMSEIAADSSEKANVRLELCALTQNALDQYAVHFKADRITCEQMLDLYQQLVSCLDAIETPEGSAQAAMKSDLQERLDSTCDTIQAAYG